MGSKHDGQNVGEAPEAHDRDANWASPSHFAKNLLRETITSNEKPRFTKSHFLPATVPHGYKL